MTMPVRLAFNENDEIFGLHGGQVSGSTRDLGRLAALLEPAAQTGKFSADSPSFLESEIDASFGQRVADRLEWSYR